MLRLFLWLPVVLVPCCASLVGLPVSLVGPMLLLFAFLHPSCLSPSTCPRALGCVSLSSRFYSLFTHTVRLSFYLTDALLCLHIALELGCCVRCAPAGILRAAPPQGLAFRPEVS